MRTIVGVIFYPLFLLIMAGRPGKWQIGNCLVYAAFCAAFWYGVAYLCGAA